MSDNQTKAAPARPTTKALTAAIEDAIFRLEACRVRGPYRAVLPAWWLEAEIAHEPGTNRSIVSFPNLPATMPPAEIVIRDVADVGFVEASLGVAEIRLKAGRTTEDERARDPMTPRVGQVVRLKGCAYENPRLTVARLAAGTMEGGKFVDVTHVDVVYALPGGELRQFLNLAVEALEPA